MENDFKQELARHLGLEETPNKEGTNVTGKEGVHRALKEDIKKSLIDTTKRMMKANNGDMSEALTQGLIGMDGILPPDYFIKQIFMDDIKKQINPTFKTIKKGATLKDLAIERSHTSFEDILKFRIEINEDFYATVSGQFDINNPSSIMNAITIMSQEYAKKLEQEVLQQIADRLADLKGGKF